MTKETEKSKSFESSKSSSSTIAKKDFIICQNEYYQIIKKGDNIDELKIPKQFMCNLKTEKVI